MNIYVARVEVRKLHCDIPEFPDIQAYGPKAEGALQNMHTNFSIQVETPCATKALVNVGC